MRRRRKVPEATCRKCGGEIQPVPGTNGLKHWLHAINHEAEPILCGSCGGKIVFDPETKTFMHYLAAVDANCDSPTPQYIKHYSSEDEEKAELIGTERFDTQLGRYVYEKVTWEETPPPDIQPLLNLIRKSAKK